MRLVEGVRGGAKSVCPFKTCLVYIGCILKFVHLKLHKLLQEVNIIVTID